jgi:hypothetical protein
VVPKLLISEPDPTKENFGSGSADAKSFGSDRDPNPDTTLEFRNGPHSGEHLQLRWGAEEGLRGDDCSPCGSSHRPARSQGYFLVFTP